MTTRKKALLSRIKTLWTKRKRRTKSNGTLFEKKQMIKTVQRRKFYKIRAVTVVKAEKGRLIRFSDKNFLKKQGKNIKENVWKWKSQDPYFFLSSLMKSPLTSQDFWGLHWSRFPLGTWQDGKMSNRGFSAYEFGAGR